jgi:hypothetical protein
MHNRRRKPKYPIDKKKLTSFSDMLHPSERFGAKVEKLEQQRVNKSSNSGRVGLLEFEH